MSYLLQCTRSTWTTKSGGMGLRFWQSILEDIGNLHVSFLVNSALLTVFATHLFLGHLFLQILSPLLTFTGKFLPHPLYSAIYKRFWKEGVHWLQRKNISPSAFSPPYRWRQTRRGSNYDGSKYTQKSSSDDLSSVLLTRQFRTTHKKWQDAISP